MNKLKKIIKIIIKILTLGLKSKTKKQKKEWKADKDNYYKYSDTSSEETSDPSFL